MSRRLSVLLVALGVVALGVYLVAADGSCIEKKPGEPVVNPAIDQPAAPH